VQGTTATAATAEGATAATTASVVTAGPRTLPWSYDVRDWLMGDCTVLGWRGHDALHSEVYRVVSQGFRNMQSTQLSHEVREHVGDRSLPLLLFLHEFVLLELGEDVFRGIVAISSAAAACFSNNSRVGEQVRENGHSNLRRAVHGVQRRRPDEVFHCSSVHERRQDAALGRRSQH
jgi:hypothetical protein